MEWLNYHHLLYFWTVAREGSIAKACQVLSLAQPTISSQLRRLESSLGGKLFDRVGRGLVLTELGQLVFRYADEIFTIGGELQDAVKGKPAGTPLSFVVGLTEVVPKLIAYRLLEPACHLSEPVRIICREGSLEDLLVDLATHRLDIVLSDAPAGSTVRVRVFDHLLGQCGVSIFASKELALRYRRKFPKSLDGAPMLLPSANSILRRSLNHWLASLGVRPLLLGEFQDSALLKVFGQAGVGLFPGPTVIEEEICRQYKVRVVGRVESVREQFYAISVERKLTHPAVTAICHSAREALFK